jgi:hypothetical protein
VRVGRGEQLLACPHFTVLELDCLGAQHCVRKIKVPRVRRHVRALRQVAQVAQIALVNDAPEILLGDAVHFAIGGGIDQIEQRRERVAQAHAAPAAVADVEDAFHLLLARCLVVEVWVLPVDRVARGCLQVAFAGAHVLILLQIGIMQ